MSNNKFWAVQIFKPLGKGFLSVCILSILSFLAIIEVRGQVQNSIPDTVQKSVELTPQTDSTFKSEFLRQIQSIGKSEYLKSQEQFENRKVYLKQHYLITELKNENFRIKALLKSGFGYNEVKSKMTEFQELIPEVLRGIHGDEVELQTERNLTVSAAILQEMLDELLKEKEKVDHFASSIRTAQFKIDSLSAEEDLYIFPSDSLQTRQYAFLLIEIAKEMKPVKDSLVNFSGKLDSLQTSLNEMVFDLNTQIENLELIRKGLNSSIFDREIPEDLNSKFYKRTLAESISYSYTKEKLALVFYLKLYQNRMVVLAILIFISWIFIKTLKTRIGLLNEQDVNDDGKVILRHPLLSSIVIVIGFFQFFFPSPPFVFYWVIWFVASISISLIFSNFLKRFWFFFWVFTVLIFLLSGITNMVLLPTAKERFLLITLSLIGILFLGSTFIKNKSDQLNERRIVYFIYFMGIFEFISLILNLAGRFNLSKSFLVAGYIGIVVGILLLWTVRLINQGLAIATKIYHNQEKELFFINFERLGNKAPGIFYTFLVFGWVVLVGKNFYSFSKISLSINQFLNEKRMIGSYEFSINGIFVFLVILLVSVLISRLLSIFTADPETNNSQDQRKRVSFGSWLLLVQIFVISLGLFLAFAASGIPLDKITIILGALSVGIGLGLQSLVNNLVSGLILAFENTVKVGDLIEIEGKPGIMKSIGFRSSVVNMFEGPTVIIPNGDLISKQLINWTTGRGRKLTAVIGVAYGTDLELAIHLLKEIVGEESRIRMNPAPRVVPLEFTDSSIDIEVTFWVNSYLDYPFVKGDLISKANEAFKQNGIQIPFPQLDLHVKPELKGPNPKSSRDESNSQNLNQG